MIVSSNDRLWPRLPAQPHISLLDVICRFVRVLSWGNGIVVSLTLIFGLFMFVHLSAIRNRLEQLSSDCHHRHALQH
jgi:hypothetical protein